MWSLARSLSVRTTRRSKRPADRRQSARRLLLEGLEDRCLMAFNVLAEYATDPNPQDLALTQIDADSQPDMVVVDYYGSDVDVRLGDVAGDGTFGDPQSSTTGAGTNPRSVATGDFNGGGTDLVTANTADVSLLLGNGDGTFGAPQSIALPPQTAPEAWDPAPLPQYPLSVATGDVNGDGKLDLVVLGQTAYCPYYCYYNNYVNVLLGNGAGGLAAPQVHHAGTNYYPSDVAVGDVNGDTKPDVIIANNSYYNALTVLLNEADEPNELALGSPVHSGTGSALRSITLGDVDGDGNVDTLLGGGGGLYVQKGDGAGGFTAQPYVSAGNVNSAVIGDINDDGKMDLVAAGADNWYTCTSWGWYGCYSGYWTSSRHATVLLGNGEGAFAVPLTSSLGSESPGYYDYLSDLAIADLTGDDLPELVVLDPYFNKAIVATNDGAWNPPPSISISDADFVVEGDTGTVNAVFTVNIVTVVGEHSGVSVDYSTSDYTAAAGSDYTSTEGTLNFAVGQTSKTISVPVHGDVEDEDYENFYVNLSTPVGGEVTDWSGFGTIQDDDTDPVFSISDAPTIVEGNGGTLNAVFTVTLAGERKGGVATVDYEAFDYTASAGADYTATSGTLTFGVDETSKEISVPILDDGSDEYDELFYVALSNASAANLGDSYYGYATIQDDDAAPLVTINNVSRNEGQNRRSTPFEFIVSLSAPSEKWVSVDFATANGSATVAGNDYFAASGTLSFAPGETTRSLTVTVRGDKTKEPNETFVVNLSDAVDGNISDSQGTGTILNDDGGKGKTQNARVSAALLAESTLVNPRKRR